ncbi:MAG: hypothetical protein U9R74_07790 [Pseudomonadota bacterium]|nr:hypothetical protein [Pseudomonadota bacterium]
MTDNSHLPSENRQVNLMIWRFLGMSAAALAFWSLSHVFLGVNCWVLFPILVVLAWPIWEYQREYSLFHRRAVLSGVTRPESRVRGIFWAGTFTLAIQAVVSVLLAILLLALSVRLTPAHWAVLALDVPLLLGLIAPANRILISDVRPERLAMAARRWPLLLLNGALIVAAFLAIDFYGEIPDTRNMDWNLVAESAFAETNNASGCRLSGWLTGAASAADALGWHAAQLLIPNLPGMPLKLLAWLIFLLQAGTIAWIYTRILLGTSALVEKTGARRQITASGTFVTTILILAAIYSWLTWKLSNFDPATFGEPARDILNWTNPCPTESERRERIANELSTEIEHEKQATIDAANKRIDAGVDELFSDVEKGVDAYLAWYFSVLGEYELLFAMFTGDVAGEMKHQIEKHLFVGANFESRLDELDQSAGSESSKQLSNVLSKMTSQTQVELSADPCGSIPIDPSKFILIGHEKLRASAAAASGTAIGVVAAKALAGKTASGIAAKVLTKKTFKAVSTLAAKAAAKKGGSFLFSAAGAAVICSPGGWLALVCGVGAGVAAWLAVDKILVEIDRMANEDKMREEMLEALQQQKLELAREMKDKHRLLTGAMAGQIQEAVDRTFVPARDGL